ncbi:HNH endonuclease signature motif containing protein [Marihabitans asiaticum]
METTSPFAPPAAVLALRDRRVAMEGAVRALDGVEERLFEAGTAEIDELLALTDELVRRAEAARFSLVREAHERGLVAESDVASLTAWVIDRSMGARQAGGGGIARAVTSLEREINALVREAVESGRISVSVANVVIAEITKIESRLAEGARDAVLGGMITMGEIEGARGVRRVRPELLARYGIAGELEREQDRLRRGRALSRPVVDDGLHEYRLVLDPEGAAVLEAALEALSSPAPCEDPQTGVVERDLRSSDQRRADALIDLVRGATSVMDTRAGRGAKASLLVTMGLDQLRAGLGAGRTLGGLDAGTLLDPTTVRRLSCDAELIPVTLGGAGEVLELGRGVRLFSAMQVKTLWLRDGGCTYPGCTTPARWCDAHHLIHWADAGPTDLSNAALLCQRHHTLVHGRRLAGEVSSGAGSSGGGSSGGGSSGGGSSGGTPVIWDLSPGSYDRMLIHPARAG